MNKRRVIEGLKSALILLLAVSAIYLLTMTPLVQDSGLVDLFSGALRDKNSGAEVETYAAAPPSRMAIVGLSGRYGVQYRQEEVDQLFFRFGSLLGDAMVSAGEPQEITENHWRQCLSRMSVYFDFDSNIPLSALGSWLQSEGQCGLPGSARRILLTEGEEDRVVLCYQSGEDGLFYFCDTGLSRSLHLEPMVENIEGNSAGFAYENEKLAPLLQPYTLLTEDSNEQIYAGRTPLTEELGADILERLDFKDDNHVAVSGGQAYLDGSARLEVSDEGMMTFSDGHERKYPVNSAGDEPTTAELIEAARTLADITIGRECGEAELYLVSIQPLEEEIYRIRFGYRINGSAVWLYEEGWAAQFVIQDGVVSEFTLHFRSYAATDEINLLLPVDRAAVILPGLVDERSELVIRYRDRGSYLVTPGWVAR